MNKRFVSIAAVVGSLGFASMLACGSSSNNGPDAKQFKDAKNEAFGLGTSCTQGGSADQALCMAQDPICTTVQSDANGNPAPPFWCTAGCGFGSCATGGTPGSADCFGSGSNQPQPPSGGDQICRGMTEGGGGTGTGACALFGQGPGSNASQAGSAIAWGCAILCGTNGSNNFGNCPSGLTCSGNFCQ